MGDGGLEWGVDWASARTWWKFIGLSVLIALVLALSNFGVIGMARLAASLTHGNWASVSFTFWNPEVELPFLHVVAAALVLWMALVAPINRWASRHSSPMAADDFPMGILEDDKKGHFGWLAFILALYSMMFIALTWVPAGVFSVADDNWNLFFFALIMLVFSKDGIKALYWRVLSDKRPPDAWASVRQSRIAQVPGLVIAVLAAISVAALISIAVLTRG